MARRVTVASPQPVTRTAPSGATGSKRRLGIGVALLGRQLLNVCVKFWEDEVESGVRSTSADTLSDQPLSEWPAGRDADRTLAQRTAAVGLTDRGSLSELALITDHRCGMLMTVVREAWRSEAGLTGSVLKMPAPVRTVVSAVVVTHWLGSCPVAVAGGARP